MNEFELYLYCKNVQQLLFNKQEEEENEETQEETQEEDF